MIPYWEDIDDNSGEIEMNGAFLSGQSHTKFHKARRNAFLEVVFDYFNGESPNLLSFEDVRKELHLNHCQPMGLQNVEIDKIVGSLGRYEDFTRHFFPRRDSDSERWRRIFDLTESQAGFPPVELYQVGETYFVRDGNHRISVAKANGAKTIEAHVMAYTSPIDLEPEDTMDAILIKLGAVNFVKATRLDELRPDHNIQLTNPGRYRLLLEHIAVHKYLREKACGCEISSGEAVVSWYDTVYLPLIEQIKTQGLLSQFPGRTKADLYAWLVLHRADLEAEYGFGQVSNDVIIQDLAQEVSPLKRIERAIKDTLHLAN